jgi:hypothetical protein
MVCEGIFPEPATIKLDSSAGGVKAIHEKKLFATWEVNITASDGGVPEHIVCGEEGLAITSGSGFTVME